MNEPKPQTAAELMAELNADPDFLLRQRERNEARQRQEADLRLAQQPLLDELRSVGLAVHSVWDLVNTTNPYPQAIPILLKHLQLPYPDRVREGIARALAVPEARSGWQILVDQFQRDEDRSGLGAKAGLAAAIAAVADDNVLDDVIELLADPQHGQNRLLLVTAVARSSLPRAREALIALSSDPALADEIHKALRRPGRRRRAEP
jgi:hypothetical protein